MKLFVQTPVSVEQLETLRPVFKVGFEQAMTVLGDMTAHKLKLLDLSLTSPHESKPFATSDDATICLEFSGELAGFSAVVFSASSAAAMVSSLSKSKRTSIDIDPLRTGTLLEIGNIVLNSVLGQWLKIFDAKASFSLPYCVEGVLKSIPFAQEKSDKKLIRLDTLLNIDGLEVSLLMWMVVSATSLEKITLLAPEKLNA
ncbi:MAG: hypothetical protein AUK35_04725 [Zetaproteobacteria bacterium CG2_30_46_52]|nr:MAG: hypothetical protein AUK35_04725 [Zetaproteobacteria bacterium CG2_30_46_52]